MKFKYLITLPMVALLASCGTQPEQVSARVKQKLPEDVVEVSDAEKSSSLVEEAVRSVSRFTLEDAMYNAQYSAEVSGSGKLMNFSVRESAQANLSVSLGFEKYDQTDAEEPEDLFRGYIGVTDLDIHGSVQVPQVKEKVTRKEAPEYELKTYELDVDDVTLPMYYIETDDETDLYINASSSKLQDLIVTVAGISGMDEDSIDGMLDLVLGELPEGQQYRPGKLYLNVTSIMNGVLNEMFKETGVPAQFLEIAKHPFKFASSYLTGMLASVFTEANIEAVTGVIESLKPTIGAKYDEKEALSKVSLVWNSTYKNAIKKMGGDPSEMPISGSFGLLVSAGTENGSKELALQEVQAKMDLKGPFESEMGKLTISSKIDMDLSASYGELAVVPSMPDGELVTSYVENSFAEMMITSLIINELSKQSQSLY